MNSFWIARIVAISSVMLIPLAVLAEAIAGPEDKPATKPPVGDFDPPRSNQIQIIDDGPVVHDYRSAPQAPVTQESWKNTSNEDLWKSTCETSPDIQFVMSKLFVNDPGNTRGIKWLADIGRATSTSDYLLHQIPGFTSDPHQPDQENQKKARLNPAECIAIFQMIRSQKEKLDQTYEEYLSTDKQQSKLARKVLLEMAGAAAVERLDRAIARWSHR